MPPRAASTISSSVSPRRAPRSRLRFLSASSAVLKTSVRLDGRALNVAEAFERRLNRSLRYVKRLDVSRSAAAPARGDGRRGGALEASAGADGIRAVAYLSRSGTTGCSKIASIGVGDRPHRLRGTFRRRSADGGAEHRIAARATLSCGTGAAPCALGRSDTILPRRKRHRRPADIGSRDG